MDCIESISSLMETEEEQQQPKQQQKSKPPVAVDSSAHTSSDDSFSELVVVESPGVEQKSNKNDTTTPTTPQPTVPVVDKKETPPHTDTTHDTTETKTTTNEPPTTESPNIESFCKVQEPPTVSGGTPRFHLIPLSEFVDAQEGASVAKLKASIQAKVPAGQRLTQGGYLYHSTTNNTSLIAITSDQVLTSLVRVQEQLTIILPEPGMESYQWPSFDVEIQAAWDGTSSSSARLLPF